MSVNSLRFSSLVGNSCFCFNTFHLPPSTFHLIPYVSLFLLYQFLSLENNLNWKVKSAPDCNSGWRFVCSCFINFFLKSEASVFNCVVVFFFLFFYFSENLKLLMFEYRFDGRDFLEKMRGKSIMFVGDSLSRNQWQSLTCLLHSAVPNSNYTLDRVGDVSIFTLTVWFSNFHYVIFFYIQWILIF